MMNRVMSWAAAILKVIGALFLLAIAKVTLRTNPDLAVAILGGAAALFLLWYFLPYIRRFLEGE